MGIHAKFCQGFEAWLPRVLPVSITIILIASRKICQICRKVDHQRNSVGACDGCINTKGMYVRFDSKERTANGQCSADDSEVSHNNGLGPTLEILEKIYKDPMFPPLSTQLDSSLFDQGISRADFWAFATITAVEYGIDMNNIMCDNPDHLSALNLENYSYNSGTSGIHRHGSIHQGEPDCKVYKVFLVTV